MKAKETLLVNARYNGDQEEDYQILSKLKDNNIVTEIHITNGEVITVNTECLNKTDSGKYYSLDLSPTFDLDDYLARITSISNSLTGTFLSGSDLMKSMIEQLLIVARTYQIESSTEQSPNTNDTEQLKDKIKELESTIFKYNKIANQYGIDILINNSTIQNEKELVTNLLKRRNSVLKDTIRMFKNDIAEKNEKVVLGINYEETKRLIEEMWEITEKLKQYKSYIDKIGIDSNIRYYLSYPVEYRGRVLQRYLEEFNDMIREENFMETDEFGFIQMERYFKQIINRLQILLPALD